KIANHAGTSSAPCAPPASPRIPAIAERGPGRPSIYPRNHGALILIYCGSGMGHRGHGLYRLACRRGDVALPRIIATLMAGNLAAGGWRLRLQWLERPGGKSPACRCPADQWAGT